MICSRCKLEKDTEKFTTQKSKKGTGLCKTCKKEIDSNYYRKSLDKEKTYFKLIPDMLNKHKKSRIGILSLEANTNRAFCNTLDINKLTYFGLKSILSELEEPYDFIQISEINEYEFVLCSLTSVMDVENLIYTFEKFAPDKINAKIIVGGFGVCNIKLITQYIDIACFGRGEGQINQIISGKRFDNVWRKEDDPYVKNNYYIRQPKYLVKGENSVGCYNKCKFCHYTYVRSQLITEKYNPGKGMNKPETDWNALSIDKAGCYISAWDGFSENTRLRVSKPIKDIDIINKFIEIDSMKIKGCINIKLYQIVGYPWENIETVENDISNLSMLLSKIDSFISTNIYLNLFVTPFGPEPMTPMQYDAANIDINWYLILSARKIYDGIHLRASINPLVGGSYTLLKRVFIHRAEISDLETFKMICFNSRLKRMLDKDKIRFLKKYYIDENMFKSIHHAAFDYLKIERN